jgi:hypothetical protein
LEIQKDLLNKINKLKIRIRIKVKIKKIIINKIVDLEILVILDKVINNLLKSKINNNLILTGAFRIKPRKIKIKIRIVKKIIKIITI